MVNVGSKWHYVKKYLKRMLGFYGMFNWINKKPRQIVRFYENIITVNMSVANNTKHNFKLL